MNWASKINLPGIKNIFSKLSIPDHKWLKCPISGEMIFIDTLESTYFVSSSSGYHFRINAEQRLKFFFHQEKYSVIEDIKINPDRLNFKDSKKYTERLKIARSKNDQNSAVVVAEGSISSIPVITIVQDFFFMGGSLGVAEGIAISRGIELACEKKYPLIFFISSGGARMQEGLFALMQMPSVTSSICNLKDMRLPYIVVYTDPTTGGVAASYASIADVHIAEPGALIGFSGPRVIEQTIKKKIPEDLQKSENLLDRGMVDLIVDRRSMKNTIVRIISILMKIQSKNITLYEE